LSFRSVAEESVFAFAVCLSPAPDPTSNHFPINHLQNNCSKTPQKTLVKSHNHLNPTKNKRSKWHFSFTQSDRINL
jgi:hypothetical protein